MPTLDELKASFRGKLDQQQAEHAARLQAEVQALRQRLLGAVPPSLPADLKRRLQQAPQSLPAASPPAWRAPALFDMGQMDQLKQLDGAFWEHFGLGRHLRRERLGYPTVYCETLDEFYTPLVEMQDLSPQRRAEQLQAMIQQAQEMAEQSQGGGTFGFNLSGRGCYLNGWLFVYGQAIPPRRALEDHQVLTAILGTAAHEKLGHGFLDLYTALGGVKTRLGLGLVEVAAKFGLRPADDPLSSLRLAQHNLLFHASQYLEEGWATWVEYYLAERLLGGAPHPHHSLERIWAAIETLPADLPERQGAQEALRASLAVLFGEEDQPAELMHTAVRLLEGLGSQLDEHFMQAIHQPLRYAAGELLFAQAEHNQGALCAPYTAIIAANLTFDPAQISLNDLASLLAGDPRLNPDTRLACLSRLRLASPDSVAELARRAEAELSLSVPPELKQ